MIKYSRKCGNCHWASICASDYSRHEIPSPFKSNPAVYFIWSACWMKGIRRVDNGIDQTEKLAALLAWLTSGTFLHTKLTIIDKKTKGFFLHKVPLTLGYNSGSLKCSQVTGMISFIILRSGGLRVVLNFNAVEVLDMFSFLGQATAAKAAQSSTTHLGA